MASSLSDFLGWLSILCWLGAQLPQVVENYRNQSSEGLSLPFLLNWLLGDITNLIGCILTHQLPFQRYLATYFVAIDTSLLAQFYYYRRPAPPPIPAPARSRAASFRRHQHYRSLSNVAANVAAAAAIAAHESQDPSAPGSAGLRGRYGAHSLTRSGSRGERGRVGVSASMSPSVRTGGHGAPWEGGAIASEGGSHVEDRGEEADEEPDDAALARMMASFRSEGGGGGRGRGGSSKGLRVSWFPNANDDDAARTLRTHSSMQFTENFATRGRAKQRAVGLDGADEEGGEPGSGTATPTASRPSTRERRNSRASRRGAGMVFLAAFALFGAGSFVRSRGDALNTRPALVDEAGRVLGSPVYHIEEDRSHSTSGSKRAIMSPSALDWYKVPPETLNLGGAGVLFAMDEPPPSLPSTSPKGEEASLEWIIGRISAWICTTLYLTSRLPQIWKNFVRKSVDGLSIALFIFAFLGNSFYVASILTSPSLDPTLHSPAERTAFIRESVPYLLGSGGTLIFDVTVVMQFFIYRRRGRGRYMQFGDGDAGKRSKAGLAGSLRRALGGAGVGKAVHVDDDDEEAGLLERGESLDRGAGLGTTAVEEDPLMSASWISSRSARSALRDRDLDLNEADEEEEGHAASPSRTIRSSTLSRD